jgi:small-conductance mechanosensitive channel
MVDTLGHFLPQLGKAEMPGGQERLVVALALWLLLALVLWPVLKLGRNLSQNTSTELDDVLLTQIRTPFWTTFVFLALFDMFGSTLGGIVGQGLRVVLEIGLIYSVVWLAQRVVIDVVLEIAKRRAMLTDTGSDDILVPIVASLIRPLTIGVGTMFALEAAGLPIAGAALLVGGASFVLAFALQSTLEDVFGGVALVVDTERVNNSGTVPNG